MNTILAYEFFEKLKAKFPELELAGLRPQIDSPDDIWLDVIFPAEVERKEEIRDFAAPIGVEYAVKHDILFGLMPADPSISYGFDSKEIKMNTILAYEFFEKLKAKFPELELVRLRPQIDSPDDIWLDVIFPADEARQEEIQDFSISLGVAYLEKHYIRFGLMRAMPAD